MSSSLTVAEVINGVTELLNTNSDTATISEVIIGHLQTLVKHPAGKKVYPDSTVEETRGRLKREIAAKREELRLLDSDQGAIVVIEDVEKGTASIADVVTVIMSTMCVNKFAPSPPTVNVALGKLSIKDARRIGVGLNVQLLAYGEAGAAVDEFIHAYPALAELDAESSCFRRELEKTAEKLLVNGDLGAKLRLFVGAALSTGDLVTDIIMIKNFFQAGQLGFAWGSVAMILGNIAFQSLLVMWNNANRGKKVIVMELLITWSCVKPGVDAYRVASGNDKVESVKIFPDMEMAASKSSEMLFESIPGLILQLIAYLSTKEKSKFAAFSLIMSAATTAFTSCMITFDKDVRVENRKNDPGMYGMFRNGMGVRAKTFSAMYGFTLAHVMARSLGFVLALKTFGSGVALGQLGVELAVFILYKIARRDFWYWPVHDGFLNNVFAAFVVITLSKMLTDFSALLQWRHPYDLGGALFSLQLIWSQVSNIAFGYLYISRADENDAKLSDLTVIAGIGACGGLWLICIVTFLRLINPAHRKVFYSTETAWAYSVRYFRDGQDFQKKDMFSTNPRHWQSIESEVMEWTHANWSRWKNEKPPWFDEHWISLVDDKFIPIKLDPDRPRRKSSLTVPEPTRPKEDDE